MKICIISDSHDNRFLLKKAVEDAMSRGAEAILHCGDVVAPTTLRILLPLNIDMHVIHGNNTGDTYNLAMLSANPDNHLHYHGQDAGIELAGRKIFLVHYPHYARAMCATGDWDLVCCGHDHRTYLEKIHNVTGGETVLLNPGTVGGVGASPSYALGDLETMQFELLHVPIDDELAYNQQHVTPHHDD